MKIVVTCEECGSKVEITEIPMSFPGGSEREDVYCPVCSSMIDSLRTRGVIKVRLLDE